MAEKLAIVPKADDMIFMLNGSVTVVVEALMYAEDSNTWHVVWAPNQLTRLADHNEARIRWVSPHRWEEVS